MMTETEKAAAEAFTRQHPGGAKRLLAELGVEPRTTIIKTTTLPAKKAAPPIHPKLAAVMKPRQPRGKAPKVKAPVLIPENTPVPQVVEQPVEPAPVPVAGFFAKSDTANWIEFIPPHTREGWMRKAIELLTPRFEAAGHTVPPVRISVGWPGGRGKKVGVVGQCWHGDNVEDGVPAIFVSPARVKPIDVLETITHELVHAVLGPGVAHRGQFPKLAAKVGLQAPWTGTDWAPEARVEAEALLEKLGPLDHSQVREGAGTRRVQPTRMLKVTCVECGCVIRMTNKWIEEVGLPVCGCGGDMEQA